MPTMFLKSRLLTLMLISGMAVISLAGCGNRAGRQQTAPASGVVTLDGKPVPQGSLLFVPVVPGPPGQANLKPDGTFVAGTYEATDGLIPGEYRVAISGQMEIDPEVTGTPMAENVSKVKAPEQLPIKFGDDKSSGLTASIKKGEKNVLTFDLKK